MTNTEKKNNLIILTGPTAVGKTALSLKLANDVGGEIVSADSIQVYKHFDIGSAKIPPEEMQGIPHHLIDILEPKDSFNVMEFKKYAEEAMAGIYERGHIPIITGGTGFYIQALLYDISFDEEDIFLTHQKLSTETIEEIEKDPYFNKNKWDEYAKKDACFLMLETEFPHVMDDIEPSRIAKARFMNRSTREIFRQKEVSYEISWCIAALPNEIWAKDLFPNDKNAYQKLENIIYEMCMVDTKDPIKSWNDYINKSKEKVKKLNDLEIKSMHYTNGLGTNLTVEMPQNTLWVSAANEEHDNIIVNMPSYEIFSSPDYRKTSGIVYSSRPLIYGGGTIDEFFIEFRDGKVINYDAKVGKEILKGIIESDENACYLGEVALVNNNSPISNTKLVFGTTLFDENASCHLALGDGFSECIKNGANLTKEELLKEGINQSKNHVDFMIGTKDLEIEAETNQGKIKIFTKGNFSI